MAKILIVDDEADVRAMLRQMLERAGHRVVEAADGVEAVERFRAERPDVTITDILMPNRSGLATIMEIRNLDPDAPVLAISGGGRQGKMSHLSTARTFVGVETLSKPFRRADLLSRVERLGARSVPGDRRERDHGEDPGC